MQFTDPVNAWKGTVSAIGLGILATPKTFIYYSGKGYEQHLQLQQQYGINPLDFGRPKW